MENVFEGKWIAPRELWDNLHVIFTKRFSLDEFESAKIRISADDYYKLLINGKFVGQGPAPSYFFAQNFNEYDITNYLTSGENKIDVLVYYQGLKNRVWLSGDGRVGMISDLFIDDKLFLSSDESWQYCIDNSFIESETVGYETAYLENRDMRLKCSEFKTPAEIKHDYEFKSEPFPSLQVTSKKVEPIISGSKYFYDFLQEYVCNIRVKANSDQRGKKIIIRCAEEVDENGSLRYDMRCGVKYEEYCILDKGESLIEQFDYKAFRYLEIEAESGIETDAEILIRHYPFDDFEFNLENEKLGRVLKLCKNTVLLGAQETLVDCPTREKGQYLGDVFISGFAHYYLTKDFSLLKKAIEDFASSVDYCGRFLAVAPCAYEQEIADYALLFSNLVYKYYSLSGDLDFLKKMIPVCELINSYYSSFAGADGMLESADKEWNLVDWPENMRDGYELSKKHCVLNAHYINSVINEEKIKSALNIFFEEKSSALKNSFIKAFLNEKTGLFVDNESSEHFSLHSNMFPLAFGLFKSENICNYLIQRGMQCSVFGAYFFLKALCNSDRKDAALGFITDEGKHSWLNMLNEGATTLFEAWGKEEKWNTSLFHPWGAAPILIYFEDLENENII